MSTPSFDLGQVIRDVVANVNELTATFQCSVEHWAWQGLLDDDSPDFGSAPIVRQAIVEASPSNMGAASGDVVDYRHHIVFLTPIEPHGASGRTEPIDARDKFVLPDGSSGPIVRINGPVDETTRGRYVTEVWLGAGSSR